MATEAGVKHDHGKPRVGLVVHGFARALMDAGIVTTVRKTRGDDIDAACGQLAGDVMDRTRVGERMAKQRTILLKVMT